MGISKRGNKYLRSLFYFLAEMNYSRYPVINGQDIKTPEEIITEDMCRQGIDYSEKVLEIAESFLRKYGII
ncbi:MAG: hypothetical protein RXR43_11930 [Sulfolobus sp.]